MKFQSILNAFIIFILSFLLTGCGLIEGIFEFGFWMGVIVVLLIIGLIGWLIYAVVKKMF